MVYSWCSSYIFAVNILHFTLKTSTPNFVCHDPYVTLFNFILSFSYMVLEEPNIRSSVKNKKSSKNLIKCKISLLVREWNKININH